MNGAWLGLWFACAGTPHAMHQAIDADHIVRFSFAVNGMEHGNGAL